MKKYLMLLLIVLFGLQPYCAEAKKDKVVRLLSIGNSFSQDAVDQHLHEIAEAEGISLVVGNLYIGGSTLKQHLSNATTDKPAYKYRKIAADGKITHVSEQVFKSVLADEPWDYVCIQQQSGRTGIYSTWEESLPQLLEYIKARVPEDARFMLHLTWSYDPGAVHRDYYRHNYDSVKMYEANVDAVYRAAELVDIKTIIPSGTAIQNARTTPLVSFVTRDGYHLHKPIGRYTVACTWFEKIFRKRVANNSYYPEGMTEEQVIYARKAAHAAVKKPKKVTKI